MPACVQHGSSFGLPKWRALHLSSQAPPSAWALNRCTFRHRTLSNVERSQVAVLHFAYRACFATERVFTITQAPSHPHTDLVGRIRYHPVLYTGSTSTHSSCHLLWHPHSHPHTDPFRTVLGQHLHRPHTNPVLHSGIHLHTTAHADPALYSGIHLHTLTTILSRHLIHHI